MSALLEACGWAVNSRMYMTKRLGYLFSHTPNLPKGARKERRDLVTLFVRETGYGAFRWTRTRVGLVSLLATLLTIALLGTLWGNQIKTLVQTWMGG